MCAAKAAIFHSHANTPNRCPAHQIRTRDPHTWNTCNPPITVAGPETNAADTTASRKSRQTSTTARVPSWQICNQRHPKFLCHSYLGRDRASEHRTTSVPTRRSTESKREMAHFQNENTHIHLFTTFLFSQITNNGSLHCSSKRDRHRRRSCSRSYRSASSGGSRRCRCRPSVGIKRGRHPCSTATGSDPGI